VKPASGVVAGSFTGEESGMPGTAAKTVSVLALLAALLPQVAGAFDFGNMMNPGRWFNGNRDNYDDGYGNYYGPAGPGYGYPAPAPGYYAPGYGYAAPAPGYAAPGYGAPGYAVPYAAPGSAATPAPAPKTATDADAAEIARLKQRVRELEKANAGAGQSAPASPGAAYYPSTAAGSGTTSGTPISSWQTPMADQPAGSSSAGSSSPYGEHPSAASATGSTRGSAPTPENWQPSPRASPVTDWSRSSGTTSNNYGTPARSTAGARATTQYPGQQSFNLGR
jgi:hypothetical protein